MARQTEVHLVDDIDGGPADETVTFGIDGKNYEIDLSTANAEKLREQFTDYVAGARRAVTGRSVTKRARSAAPAGDMGPVREWARSQGMSVSDRGRLPKDVVAAYAAAH